MKKSLSKKIGLGLIFLIFVMCSGCSLVNDKQIIDNVIINKTVEYENFTITSMQEALQVATEKAEQTSIAITHEEGVILTSSSLGSGVIVKRIENGNNYKYYAVTNRHVVLTSRNVVSSTLIVYLDVKNPIETSIKVNAKAVAVSTEDDLALIEFTTSHYLAVAKFADSSQIKKGSVVLAIGTPYSLEYFRTSTMGIISSPLRPIKSAIYSKSYNNRFDESGTKILYFIQHDASINSGNSGGGLYDINGDLIGINTSKLVDNENFIEGMAFSIPSNVVSQVFAEYLK